MVMEKTLVKVSLCTLSSKMISSESGTSYCDYPAGLFLSRGREVLSFVCSMFITQFPSD